MTLLIDIGNTRIKAGVLAGAALDALEPLDNKCAAAFETWTAAGVACPDRVLVSNVAGPAIAGELADFVYRSWRVEAEFVSPVRECCGMTTCYEDPGRLGVDRWLAALAAWHHAGEAVCVLDVGTALTADIVTSEGEHLGGLIAPGVDLMRNSLTRGTADLSSDHLRAVEGFAVNTNDAIALGCRAAMGGLMEQLAARLADTPAVRDARWYLTGGGAPVLVELLPVPAVEMPDLVLQGLARLAESGRQA